ncbi:MAG: hypothetical protein ACRDJV_01470 [Actinomycetota bacterium]
MRAFFRRFLQAVAHSGPGIATGKRGAAAMQDDFDPYREWPGARDREVVPAPRARRLKRWAAAVAIPLVVFLVILRLMSGQPEEQAVEAFEPPPATPMPVRGAASGEETTGAGYRSYALEVTELDGLPPDAPPGTFLEVWVTWEPPLTRRIKIQKLIPRARLEKIIPNIVPEAPATALLSVPRAGVVDLMYGDRFGRLGVTVLPTAE